MLVRGRHFSRKSCAVARIWCISLRLLIFLHCPATLDCPIYRWGPMRLFQVVSLFGPMICMIFGSFAWFVVCTKCQFSFYEKIACMLQAFHATSVLVGIHTTALFTMWLSVIMPGALVSVLARQPFFLWERRQLSRRVWWGGVGCWQLETSRPGPWCVLDNEHIFISWRGKGADRRTKWENLAFMHSKS